MLIVGQTDVCLGITLFSGQGETLQHSFQFASDLRSATLEATAVVFDSVSLQDYDFDVDLTWTATGAMVSHHDKEMIHDKELGLKIDPRFAWTVVRALIAGDVLNLVGYRLRPYEVVPGSTQQVRPATSVSRIRLRCLL